MYTLDARQQEMGLGGHAHKRADQDDRGMEGAPRVAALASG
jgi:hypothetical protein